MARTPIRLPRTAQAFVRRVPHARPIVRCFHRWIDDHGVTLEMLTADDVDRFVERPFRKRIGPTTQRTYRSVIARYLLWLHDKGLLSFAPIRRPTRPTQLPLVARRFIATSNGSGLARQQPTVGVFHAWLCCHGLALSQVTVAHVDQFLERPWRATLLRSTRDRYRRCLLRYLEWLYDDGKLSFDPQCLRLHPKRLPALAEEFISSLQPTLRLSTCDGYRTNLRKFHGWLRAQDLPLRKLRRRHTSAWFRSLSDRGLHPSTRLGIINNLRVYLRWLHERGAIRADPDDLIRQTDRPKLPSYLPRPFPPDTDDALQTRLAASDDLYQQGLLLMRRTGLRIGELIGLERDCVRTDHTGNHFLKVPLGKLLNERLVPLDERTHVLVQRLRRRGRRRRRSLLETPAGTPTVYGQYRLTLRSACVGLDTAGPITTHRLRHSYATSLLNAGMSLLGVMKLLGHRDYRMTLRYTAITQQTVGREYFEALEHIQARYGPAVRTSTPTESDPAKMVSDLIRWLGAHTADRRLAGRLRKRLERIQVDLTRLSDVPQINCG